jgi:hypothetical protein
MIGNGSFAQISILDEVLTKLPSAALWFGVVSSFQSGNDALTVGNCLGRRVARDMCTDPDPFVSIRDDIAIDELAMLRSDTKSSSPFRTVQTSSMTVNLLGNVSGRFKLGNASNTEMLNVKRETEARKGREQAEELMYFLDRAKLMAAKLAQPTQGELFEEK